MVDRFFCLMVTMSIYVVGKWSRSILRDGTARNETQIYAPYTTDEWGVMHILSTLFGLLSFP